LILTIRAPFTETGPLLIFGFTGTESCHATGAFVGLIPVLAVLIAPPPSTTRGLLRNRSSAGASWAIKIVFWTAIHAGIASTETALDRLWFVKAVVVVIPTATKASGARLFTCWGRFVVEISGTARLFRRDAS
jgi:hypothetical protein